MLHVGFKETIKEAMNFKSEDIEIVFMPNVPSNTSSIKSILTLKNTFEITLYIVFVYLGNSY